MKHPGSHPDIEFIGALKRFSTVSSLATLLTALLVLGGWAFNITFLKCLIPGLVTMKPLTATAFLLAGVALWLLQREAGNTLQYRIGHLFGCGSAAIGGAILFEYVMSVDLGIDRLLFRDAVLAEGVLYPGRPAPGTAFGLLLSGTALWFLDARGIWLVPIPTLLSLLTSILALVGYAYDVSALYQIGYYSSIALHTAVILAILNLGLLAARPGHPFMIVLTTRLAGSTMMRNLLPAAVLIPFGLGWLRLTGQRMGLYGTEFGLVLFATSNTIVFTMLIYWTAFLLNRTDARREAGFAEALESNRRFSLLADASPNGLIMIDQTGQIRLANKQAEIMFGYPQSGLDGRQIETLLPARFRNQHISYREIFSNHPEARAMGTGRDLFGLRRDGLEFPVEIGLKPLTMTDEQVTLASIIDISERKRIENKLRRNEEVLRLFVEHSPAAIAMFDRNMNYIIASRRYAKDYGLSGQNLINRCHYEIFPDIPEKWKKIHRDCLAGGVAKADEDAFPRANGQVDWVRWEIHPWHETNGEIGGIILFSEVITRRKQAEDALRLLNEELEHRVLERTAALSRSEAQLTASLKEKEVLLKEIHHRVKNNLQIIASLLQLQADFMTAPGAHDPFLDSRRRVRTMALIHEQLYQSKDLANINFSEYITSLVNYIRSSHARTFSNITIRVDIAEMTLDIDRAVPLGLIISELVSNSIKYAFPAETGNKTGEIWVKAAQQSPGSLTLEIGDSGRGLPDDVDIEQPSSMGLQLVQDFVLQLNGRLVVQRRPGAIFTIVITPGNNHYG